MHLTKKEREHFSLSRLIRSAANGGIDGLEREIVGELAAEHGLQCTPSRFPIPWSVLSRDIGVSGGAGLVGTNTTDVVDILRPVSLTVSAGVTPMPNQQEDLSLPKVTADTAGEWLPDDLSPITADEPTIATVSGTPRTVAALVTYSHMMKAQATPEGFLTRHLLGLVGRLVDAAVLAGAGSGGQPEGLNTNSDVQSVTGTSLDWDAVTQMEQDSADENGAPSAYVATPAVRKLLRNRERSAGSGIIWDGSTVNGLPGYATTACPAASMFVGPWSTIMLPTWGPPQLAVNPSTLFNTGRLQLRLMLRTDVVVTQPSSFVKATSIT